MAEKTFTSTACDNLRSIETRRFFFWPFLCGETKKWPVAPQRMKCLSDTIAAMHGKLVLIIGPSGVGKSVILKKLRERHAEFHFPRSATTRPRREGESDDLYRFVTDATFDLMLKENKLLEWATVHAGARYGTLVAEIIPQIEKGQTVVREVDVQGFDSIRNHPFFSGDAPQYPMQSIFILPESKDQLIAHITKRAPIEGEELKRRIASIERELRYATLCSTQVKNVEGKLEQTLKKVESLINA